MPDGVREAIEKNAQGPRSAKGSAMCWSQAGTSPMVRSWDVGTGEIDFSAPHATVPTKAARYTWQADYELRPPWSESLPSSSRSNVKSSSTRRFTTPS